MVYARGTLKGRNCIITGASKGIGFAIAKLFHAEGASCLLISRDSNNLHVAASRLRGTDERKQNQGNVSVFPMFVEQHPAWEKLAESDWVKNNPPDVLVNAAGISQAALFLRSSPPDLQGVIQTNLMGTMWACREVSKLMKKGRNGPASIINISSLLGLRGGKGASAYAASKAGVIGLTRALALELGPMNIRVNAIVPGYFSTSMTEGFSNSENHALLQKIPLGRFGDPSEIAEAASFLALNEYANNCVLNLDGGLSASL